MPTCSSCKYLPRSTRLGSSACPRLRLGSCRASCLPPRSQLTTPKDPNHLTDAEKLARYEAWLPVLAQSGTYTVKGNILVQHRLISKDPASMNTEGGPIEFKIEGDKMTQITNSLPGQPASQTHRTYMRLE